MKTRRQPRGPHAPLLVVMHSSLGGGGIRYRDGGAFQAWQENCAAAARRARSRRAVRSRIRGVAGRGVGLATGVAVHASRRRAPRRRRPLLLDAGVRIWRSAGCDARRDGAHAGLHDPRSHRATARPERRVLRRPGLAAGPLARAHSRPHRPQAVRDPEPGHRGRDHRPRWSGGRAVDPRAGPEEDDARVALRGRPAPRPPRAGRAAHARLRRGDGRPGLGVAGHRGRRSGGRAPRRRARDLARPRGGRRADVDSRHGARRRSQPRGARGSVRGRGRLEGPRTDGLARALDASHARRPHRSRGARGDDRAAATGRPPRARGCAAHRRDRAAAGRRVGGARPQSLQGAGEGRRPRARARGEGAHGGGGDLRLPGRARPACRASPPDAAGRDARGAAPRPVGGGRLLDPRSLGPARRGARARAGRARPRAAAARHRLGGLRGAFLRAPRRAHLRPPPPERGRAALPDVHRERPLGAARGRHRGPRLRASLPLPPPGSSAGLEGGRARLLRGLPRGHGRPARRGHPRCAAPGSRARRASPAHGGARPRARDGDRGGRRVRGRPRPRLRVALRLLGLRAAPARVHAGVDLQGGHHGPRARRGRHHAGRALPDLPRRGPAPRRPDHP